MFRKKTVMILGCGPAGLFAAQAARDKGYSVAIFSARRRSDMFGAQYLHDSIPGLRPRGFTVDYRLQGTLDGYAGKVYGPENAEAMATQVSPAKLMGYRPAWDIRQAYDEAWDRWESMIYPARVTPEWIRAAVGTGKEYSLVINSIPAPQLCENEDHAFTSAEIWAIGDAPERDIRCPIVVGVNSVVCNGEPSPGWYRASYINGYASAEWPGSMPKPPIKGIARVSKPIATTCDCWTRRGYLSVPFLRIGRYGTWTKGVLSHTAYARTLDRLK